MPPRRLSKRGRAKAVKLIVKRHKGKQIQLWFQDEARVGQKGRNAHVWFEKGVRPVMHTDKRFKSVYIYGAICPGTDDAFALVLPRADTEMMRLYLNTFAKSLPADVHVVLVLDKAGWYVTGRLKPPDNITLVHLPAYSPELNPIGRFWLYLKERFLSYRIFDDQHAIVEACATAWNGLKTEAGRIASLSDYPYIRKVKT